MAEDPVAPAGAEGLRQASLPTPKTIRRRTDAPVVEKPKPIVPPPRAASQAFQQPKQQQQQVNKTEQQRGAGMPAFDDHDYIKRLTTEMEEFERDWASRRGAKVPPKQTQQPKAGTAAVPPQRQASTPGQAPKQPLFNEAMLKNVQDMAKNVDMDSLLNQTGLKDVIAPLADSFKNGKVEDIEKVVRQVSEQFLGNPEKMKGLKDSPEVQKFAENFAGQPAADSQKRQPTIADLFKDLVPPPASGNGQKAPGLDGLDDLFGSLFGGNANNNAAGSAGKKQPTGAGGWEDLFGNLFNTPPAAGGSATSSSKHQKNPYSAQKNNAYGYKNPYGHGKTKYGNYPTFSDEEDDTEWSTSEL